MKLFKILPWTIFISLASLSIAAKSILDPKCHNLNVSLTQKIDGEGFHRDLKWLLERSPSSFHCKLAIRWIVTPEIFINPDQIADLNRLGHTIVFIEGDVDVEAPAHLATEHIAYINVPPFKEKVSFNVPFHLRYQRAQISGGFAKITLNKPNILAMCPERCSNSRVKAPCDSTMKIHCGWDDVSYQVLFDEVELLVPVGDLDDYPLVSIVTLLLGCAGCIYTLSVLSTTPL